MPLNLDNEAENFRLRVESIVYDVLSNREMTVREAQNIENAIRNSIEIIIANHKRQCDKEREEMLDRKLNRVYILVVILSSVSALFGLVKAMGY